MKAWKVGIMVGALLTLFLILLSVGEIKSLFVPLAYPAATNIVTVNGTGDVVAIPDVATFSFSVTENASTVTDAQTAASTKTNAAIKAMTDAGVATADIETLSYNINPHYDYTTPPCVYSANTTVCPSGKSVLNGYDVSETVQVKVRDLTKAGTLFQTIGSLKVQSVNDLQFSIDKPEMFQDQARAKAITDAEKNAQQLAGELGVNLVRVVNFSENSGGVVTPISYSVNSMALAGKAAAAPTISQGQQKITDSVSISYEIR